MDKIMKSQILKLLLIAIFVLMTPLISSSQRTSYLYFIVNLLIISLGADAGLISFFSKSQNNNTNNLPSVISQVRSGFSESQNDDKISSPPLSPHTTTTSIKQQKVSPKVVEKCVSEKIVGVTKLAEKDEVKLQKCPSTPSLFFIWSDEDSSEVKEEEEEEISGQELFNKAETFIGNFYNQLKMQREESVESLKGVRFDSDLKICV
ncbi:hypothetical protein HAX54_016545 [Datura stramonium]|uniref:Uncharacterized protein n=1 Tax=Datura stramonium TaxID=4076 RepID=A0ABS8S0C6_DATST|nr:hypothetical protein [Datura stramonium]